MARTYTLNARDRAPARDRYRAPYRGFSPSQQGIYRHLVDDAWKAVSESGRGLCAATDTLAKDNWYRGVLHEKFGVYTSKQLNKGGDFEKACAAFEEIAGNGIYWQLRANAGPLERMRRRLAEFVRQHEVEEDYIDGISRQMFDTHSSNLDATQLNKLIAAVKIHLGRHAEAVNAS